MGRVPAERRHDAFAVKLDYGIDSISHLQTSVHAVNGRPRSMWPMLLAAAAGAAAGAAADAASAEAAEPPPKTRGQAPYGWTAGMVLVGSYTCRTPAWLILHVHACNASAVEAVFQFVYPTTTQHGAFWVSGQFGATRALKLAPTTAWLTPAPPRECRRTVPCWIGASIRPSSRLDGSSRSGSGPRRTRRSRRNLYLFLSYTIKLARLLRRLAREQGCRAAS